MSACCAPITSRITTSVLFLIFKHEKTIFKGFLGKMWCESSSCVCALGSSVTHNLNKSVQRADEQALTFPALPAILLSSDVHFRFFSLSFPASPLTGHCPSFSLSSPQGVVLCVCGCISAMTVSILCPFFLFTCSCLDWFSSGRITDGLH